MERKGSKKQPDMSIPEPTHFGYAIIGGLVIPIILVIAGTCIAHTRNDNNAPISAPSRENSSPNFGDRIISLP